MGGPENSYIAEGSVGAREVGARATLDPPRRLRHAWVELVKASETCFPESWCREMRHGRFGAPDLFGLRTSSVSTDAEKKRFFFLSTQCASHSFELVCKPVGKPHVLSLAILLLTALMILSSFGDSVVHCPAGRPAHRWHVVSAWDRD